MKRILTLAIMLGLMGGSAIYARQLTPAEALSAARRAPSGARKVAAKMDVTPVYTATSGSLNTLYVFSSDTDGGYIVVAADDVARPLLGYVDSGAFDPENIPADLDWWLQCYSQEIAGAATSSASPRQYLMPADNADRQPVSPIVKTLWNQSAPFNDLCPKLTVNGTTQPAVTGCVATAMAQVMKTHNWPERGVGSNSYTFSYQGTSYPQSYNFANTTFDWDDMLDDYSGAHTARQDTAVATLMLSCGMGVNMSYGWSSTGGSGAVSFNAAKALVNYFNYDKGVQYIPRQYFTYEQWVETIYDEVASGRPVLLGGQSAEGGHEFVCDGYSADDYFHINWGWGGLSNGYFLLSALDPASQGIGGGSNDGFNMSQDAIIGIQPPTGARSTAAPNLVLQGDFMTNSSTYSTDDYISIGAQGYTFFYSISTGQVAVTLGIKMTDASGNVSYEGTSQTLTLAPNTGTYMYYIKGWNLPEGTYMVTPAFKSGGQWYDVKVPLSNVRELQMTVTPSTVTFVEPSTEPAIEVTDFELSTPVYIGSLCDFDATIEAAGNFYGTVIPALVSGSQVVATGEAKGLSYSPGDSDTVEWVTTFKGNNLTAGDYNLVFLTQSGVAISQEYPVTVLAAQSVTPTMTVDSVVFPNSTGTGAYNDPFVIRDLEDIEAIVTMHGTQGYWADNVIGEVFNVNTGRSVATFGSSFAGMTSGETVEVTLKGELEELENGSTYIFLPWGGQHGQLSYKYSYIKIDNTVGVDDINAADDNTPAQYYTLQGVMVKNPAPGQIYIVSRGGAVTKTLYK